MKYITQTKFNKSDINPHERVMILGHTGSGKSVLVDTLLHFFSKDCFVILIDSKKEYQHIPPLTLDNLIHKKKGLARIYEIVHNDYVIDDLLTISEWICDNVYRLQQEAKLDARKKVRNIIIAIEEIGSATRKGGRLYDAMPKLAKIIQQGRGLNIGFIGISQRPQEVNTTILSQSDHIISFMVNSKHDFEAMRSYIDRDLYDNLNRFEFFHLIIKENLLKKCYKLYSQDLYNDIEYYKKIFGKH